MTGDDLPALFARTEAVLLDFDGPVCQLFAGIPTAEAAERLRLSLTAIGLSPPAESLQNDDPLAVYAAVARAHPAEARRIGESLASIEELAAATARPTPGAEAFVEACHARRLPVVLVTNNSARAANRYLDLHGINVAAINGRDQDDPGRMKPNPYLLLQALNTLSIEPDRAVMIGDAVRDVQAAAAAGVPAIGYANKPGKHERLAAAGAVAVIDSMAQLAAAIGARP